MTERWTKDLVFAHPETGMTTVIQDAKAANIFFTSYWAWALTPEFYEAVWACEAAPFDPLIVGDVRTKVRNALRSVGIDVE